MVSWSRGLGDRRPARDAQGHLATSQDKKLVRKCFSLLASGRMHDSDLVTNSAATSYLSDVPLDKPLKGPRRGASHGELAPLSST